MPSAIVFPFVVRILSRSFGGSLESTDPMYNLPNGDNVSRKSPVDVKMQTLKIVALGTLFSVVGTVGHLLLGVLIGITRGPISTGHATALSAVVAGLIATTVFSPIWWLVTALAFGLAFWLVRSRQKPKTA
jgi:hypothetical protein